MARKRSWFQKVIRQCRSLAVAFCMGVTFHAHYESIQEWVLGLVAWERFIVFNALVGIWHRIIN